MPCPPRLETALTYVVWLVYVALVFKQVPNFPEVLGLAYFKKNANGNEELMKVAAHPVDRITLEIKKEASSGSPITLTAKPQQPREAQL